MSDFERTFDQATVDYEKSRPAYPTELFDDLFAYQPLSAKSRVLEIGAGTGKASAPVLDTGCCLDLLEPGANLISLAKKKWGTYPNAAFHQCTLQDFQCEPEMFDLIYAATSFHWIPEEYGYRRVHELLKPGGAFARFAYHAGPDQSRPELKCAIQKVYDRFPSLASKGTAFGMDQARQLAGLAAHYDFTDTCVELYETQKDFTADAYMQLLRTYPAHMALEDQDRNELFDGIHHAILQHGGVITVYYTFDLELCRKR